jgi:cell division protein FtsB
VKKTNRLKIANAFSPKRRKKRVSFFVRATVVIVLIFSAWGLWQYYQMSVYVNQQKQKIELIQQEIDKIKAENRRLLRELEEMGSQEYLERIAREDYGMIKDGEKVVIFQDEIEE